MTERKVRMFGAAVTLMVMAAPCAAQPVALPSAQASLSSTQSAALPPSPAQSRISGKWLLAIDAAPLARPIKPLGSCQSQEITLDLNNTFATALDAALPGVFERVEPAQLPFAGDELKVRKAKGLITVKDIQKAVKYPNA